MERDRDPLSRLVTGTLILAIGLILWFDHLGRLEARDWFRWWSVALIVYGIAHFAQSRWLSAALLTIFGLVLLPPVRIFTGFHIWQVFALTPLFISAAGVTLVVQALRQQPKNQSTYSRFRAIAVMAGNVRAIRTDEFPGGDVVAVMGGCQLDLTGVPSGHEVVIDVLAFWGGVDIRVPRGWKIENHVAPILGALEDTTTPPTAADAPRLIIRGSAIMGGIEVKNSKEETS